MAHSTAGTHDTGDDRTRMSRWSSFLRGSSLYSLPLAHFGFKPVSLFAQSIAFPAKGQEQDFELFATLNAIERQQAMPLPAPAVAPAVAPAPAPSPETLAFSVSRNAIIAGIFSIGSLFAAPALAFMWVPGDCQWGHMGMPNCWDQNNACLAECAGNIPCTTQCGADWQTCNQQCELCPPTTWSTSCHHAAYSNNKNHCQNGQSDTPYPPPGCLADEPYYCAAGTYVVSNSCMQCMEGTFTDQPNQTNCTMCVGNTIAANMGSSSCTACGANTTANAGHTFCDPDCPPGSYGNSMSCMQCMEGYFSTSYNSPSCDMCGYNQIAANPGSTSCSTCPPGTEANMSRTECIPYPSPEPGPGPGPGPAPGPAPGPGPGPGPGPAPGPAPGPGPGPGPGPAPGPAPSPKPGPAPGPFPGPAPFPAPAPAQGPSPGPGPAPGPAPAPKPGPAPGPAPAPAAASPAPAPAPAVAPAPAPAVAPAPAPAAPPAPAPAPPSPAPASFEGPEDCP